MFSVKYKLINMLSYRLAMKVKEACLYNRSQDVYALCPRCKIPIEREYQAYCDRCGQALKWNNFEKLKIKHLY